MRQKAHSKTHSTHEQQQQKTYQRFSSICWFFFRVRSFCHFPFFPPVIGLCANIEILLRPAMQTQNRKIIKKCIIRESVIETIRIIRCKGYKFVWSVDSETQTRRKPNSSPSSAFLLRKWLLLRIANEQQPLFECICVSAYAANRIRCSLLDANGNSAYIKYSWCF